MDTRQWRRYFIDQLQHLDFQSNIINCLASIANADGKTRPAMAARFGGVLRLCRSDIRIKLARALMEELEIVPTLHVARYVMLATFGEAAASDMLDQMFAQPGRDATLKYMNAAQRRMAERPGAIERYAELYEWYCRALKLTVIRLKKRAAARRNVAGPR